MSRALRIGVFGGTFDPIHETHLSLARTALSQATLDRVLFVVSAVPPHKRAAVTLGPEERFALVSAALAGEPQMEASRIELEREGPSYTADTLELLAAAHPGAELFLILGMDATNDVPRWHQPERILARAKILTAGRPGQQLVIPPLLEGRCQVLEFPEQPVSSTEVRARLARGESVAGLLPPAVIAMIEEHGWYRNE